MREGRTNDYYDVIACLQCSVWCLNKSVYSAHSNKYSKKSIYFHANNISNLDHSGECLHPCIHQYCKLLVKFYQWITSLSVLFYMRHIQLFSQKAMMQQQHQFIAFLSFFKLLVSELVNISCCVKIKVSILPVGYCSPCFIA